MNLELLRKVLGNQEAAQRAAASAKEIMEKVAEDRERARKETLEFIYNRRPELLTGKEVNEIVDKALSPAPWWKRVLGWFGG